MKNHITLTPAYDVSAGDTNFTQKPFLGTNFLSVQFLFSSLSQADNKIKLQESIDGVNFVNSLDSSGSAIEMIIDNSLSFDILKVNEFNSAYFRFQFIEGTAGTGTIDKLIILSE